MESSHFYFAMFVSLVLLTLGWTVATAHAVGYSLMGLGCGLAALAIANRYIAAKKSQEPAAAPVRIDVSQQRPLEQ